MKINQKYLLLSVATVLAVTAISLGAPSSAQTLNPVTCSVVSASPMANQSVILAASGGNGIYTWSGTGFNSTTAGGTQFAVSYPNAGNYTAVVTSGGLSATCNVAVAASTANSGDLKCSPTVQTVTLGQTASVNATGGTGVYTWSSPELTIGNPNGSGFSASYASAGVKLLTVSNSGATSVCAINVLPNNNVPPVVIPPVVPGLPNTGGGYGQN